MATKLTKNVTRESTVEKDGRALLVTLTEDQEIILKQKGLRNDGEKIKISDLFDLLTGGESEVEGKESGGVVGSGVNAMIKLSDLRSINAIAGLDYETTVKFESIILRLMQINA